MENETQNLAVGSSESPHSALITVIDVTYITTGKGGAAEFIGLWYRDETAAHLLFFSADRVDLLALEEGDKGVLAFNQGIWKFTPRSN